MDEKCNFLVKLLAEGEEILFCELVLAERKTSRVFYKNIIEICRDSLCESTNHENCRHYRYKIDRLDELEA